MKSKKVPTLIAKVGDFLFDENETKVVLLRCEDTVFPNDEQSKFYSSSVLADIHYIDKITI